MKKFFFQIWGMTFITLFLITLLPLLSPEQTNLFYWVYGQPEFIEEIRFTWYYRILNPLILTGILSVIITAFKAGEKK